jgi:hypothetical protein
MSTPLDAGTDLLPAFEQLGRAYMALLNEGLAVGLPAFLQQVAQHCVVARIELSEGPEVVADAAGNDVVRMRNRLVLAIDLDSLRAALKTPKLDVIHE